MLDRIQIKGYKSIRDLNLALRPVNILISSNGVGKSNFISFFKLVNNIYERRLQSYTMRNRAESLLYYGVKRTAGIYGCLSSSDSVYMFELSPRDDGSMFLAEERTESEGRDLFILSEEESIIRDSRLYVHKWIQGIMESCNVYHFHDTSKGSPLRSAAKVNDNRILKEDGGNLPAYLYLMQQKYPKTLKRIETVIRSVMPYFERFDLEPQALDGSIELVWNDADAPDKYFSANDLSDGSIRFIALAALLLQPELPKIIIIDEPELGLHPVAVTQLAGMIQSAAARGCQIIVSTQSVNLINHFEAEDIITVDRQDGQSVFNRLSRDDLKNWIDEYTLGELWMKNIINGQPEELR